MWWERSTEIDKEGNVRITLKSVSNEYNSGNFLKIPKLIFQNAFQYSYKHIICCIPVYLALHSYHWKWFISLNKREKNIQTHFKNSKQSCDYFFVDFCSVPFSVCFLVLSGPCALRSSACRSSVRRFHSYTGMFVCSSVALTTAGP